MSSNARAFRSKHGLWPERLARRTVLTVARSTPRQDRSWRHRAAVWFLIDARGRRNLTLASFDADIKRQGVVDWHKFKHGIVRSPDGFYADDTASSPPGIAVK